MACPLSWGKHVTPRQHYGLLAVLGQTRDTPSAIALTLSLAVLGQTHDTPSAITLTL